MITDWVGRVKIGIGEVFVGTPFNLTSILSLSFILMLLLNIFELLSLIVKVS